MFSMDIIRECFGFCTHISIRKGSLCIKEGAITLVRDEQNL